jgi:hypothetical protein
VVTALGVGALWMLVPEPAGLEAGTFYSPLGTPTTLVDLVLAIGGGLLFLRALRNFKQELKPAWRFVALAQFTLGALTLTFPYVEYYYLWPNIWWNMSTYLAFLLGSIFMYFGMRKFYKILGLQSWVTSVPIVGVVILAAWGMHALMPHVLAWVQFNELQYDLFELIPLIPLVCYSAAAYMAFRIRSKVGAEYNKSFSWLTVGLSLQAFTCLTIAVLEVIGYENWYFASRAYEIPTIVADIGILTAAYYFNAIGLPTNRFGLIRRLLHPKPQTVSSVDIIVYTVGMASDVSKIDKYLDGMRTITARHQPGDQLSEAEQSTLYSIYLNIENHLVNDEPLRTFSSDSLRQEVEQYFALDQTNADQTFWKALQQESTASHNTNITS